MANRNASRRATFRAALGAVCVDCPNLPGGPSPRIDSPLGPLTLPPMAEQAIAEVAHCRHLTPREREVLLLCCAGLKNSAIALALGISDSAVRRHLRHLHQKTQTQDKAELILNLWHSCGVTQIHRIDCRASAQDRAR